MTRPVADLIADSGTIICTPGPIEGIPKEVKVQIRLGLCLELHGKILKNQTKKSFRVRV